MYERLILEAIPTIIKVMSPTMKTGVDAMIASMKKTAAGTTNPADNVLVKILETMLRQ